MKRYLQICTIVLVITIVVFNFINITLNNKKIYKEVIASIGSEVKMISRTSGQDFEIFNDEKWKKIFLKGVNIGAAKAGHFPGEFAITKEEYLRWFKYIKDMNCNVIRIYTLSMPEFYEALHEFNEKEKEPLYLIHGVWLDEKFMEKEDSLITDIEFENVYKNEIKNVVNAINGNGRVTEKKGNAYGKYTSDVSQYVLGYILGIEWDSYFVERSNKNKIDNYKGEWVYSENASTVEVVLSRMIDFTIDYEYENYKFQRPIAITNWPTTDPIKHEDDIDIANTFGDIDINNIKARNEYKSGLFASYHIYPYYPDFLNYDKKYSDFVDESGNKNSYRAYLREIKEHHKEIPVIISEFGVPSSRGISHVDKARGFNQGLISEKDQGIMNSILLKDIKDENYAGAVVFSWQDEWFKKTWNTMEVDIANERAYWNDKMTNEQAFGLLSFESNVVKIDGETDDWSDNDLVTYNDNIKLYVKSDEAHVYIRINKKNINLENEKLLIPIDVTKKSGSKMIEGYNGQFSEEVDFVISIDGTKNSKILVQEYYDVAPLISREKVNKDKNSKKFLTLRQVVLRKSFIKSENKKLKTEYIDVGNLTHGISNFEDKEFNSLADFNINNNDIEIRIPWLMLNIASPNKKIILDDFNIESNLKKINIKHLNIEGLSFGAYSVKNKIIKEEAKMKEYRWDKWEENEYDERLKESYYIMKKAFKEIGD